MQHTPDGILFHHFQPPRIEFYALSDRGQVHDLAKQRGWESAETLEALTRWLNSRWAEYQRYGSRLQLSMDKATEERLRALGY